MTNMTNKSFCLFDWFSEVEQSYDIFPTNDSFLNLRHIQNLFVLSNLWVWNSTTSLILVHVQTPDGALLDVLRNAYELLSSCDIEIPKVFHSS